MSRSDRQCIGGALAKSAILARLLFACICFFTADLGAEEPKFRLGVSCPLSGVLAEYGVAVRNGIELARVESPE